MKYRILLLGFFVLLAFKSIAQKEQRSCTQVLNDAEDAYDQGNLDVVISLLGDAECFRSVKTDKFSDEEVIRGYRVLTLAHLFTDNEPSAEQALVNLLNADPEHPIDPREDPAEFVYLYNKYRVLPIFRIGVKIGANQSSVRSLGTFATFNTDSTSKNYGSKIGIQAEVTFEYQLKNKLKNFEAVLGLGYNIQSYEVGFSLVEARIDTAGTEVSGASITSLSESQAWLKVPLMLRFVVPIKKSIWSPYLYAGASFDYLINATMSGQRTGTVPRSVNQGDLLSLDMRTRTNLSYFGGIGVKMRANTHYVIAELRYGVGANNFVNPANRYNNDNLLFDQGHVDDDLSIDNVAFSIGYARSFYIPKKYSEEKLAKRSRKNR